MCSEKVLQISSDLLAATHAAHVVSQASSGSAVRSIVRGNGLDMLCWGDNSLFDSRLLGSDLLSSSRWSFDHFLWSVTSVLGDDCSGPSRLLAGFTFGEMDATATFLCLTSQSAGWLAWCCLSDGGCGRIWRWHGASVLSLTLGLPPAMATAQASKQCEHTEGSTESGQETNSHFLVATCTLPLLHGTLFSTLLQR